MSAARIFCCTAGCFLLILPFRVYADPTPPTARPCCRMTAEKGKGDANTQCPACCPTAENGEDRACCRVKCGLCKTPGKQADATSGQDTPKAVEAGNGRGPGRGGPGFRGGRGPGRGGPGFRGGRGADAQFQEDHEVFFFLLANGKKIDRKVNNLRNGVQTVTESDDPDVAAKIQEHVAAMYARVEEGNPIHLRDPLFAEVFRNVNKIKIVSEPTKKGVKVTETSEDPYVAKLIQAHAKVVDAFVKNGHAELRRNHSVPKK